MTRSLKTLNQLAGYLVWSEIAWGGVGEAQNTRQAFSLSYLTVRKGRLIKTVEVGNPLNFN